MPAELQLTSGERLTLDSADASMAMRMVNAALQAAQSRQVGALPPGWIEVPQDHGPVFIHASQVVAVRDVSDAMPVAEETRGPLS